MIKRPNVIIVTLICIFVIVEILFLRPSSVENGDETNAMAYNSIETMVEAEKYKDETGYTIDGFHYTAVEGEVRHWELTARQAILYEKSQIALAHKAIIRMFEHDGSVTEIHGDEARFKTGSKDLDLTGNVTVQFSDGFWIETSKAHYSAQSGAIVSDEAFHGETGHSKTEGETADKIGVKAPVAAPTPLAIALGASSEHLEVWGKGFAASRVFPDVVVHNKVHVQVRRTGEPAPTDVRSDRVRINRLSKIADFKMSNTNRFVESNQGSLEVKSRRQEVSYANDSSTIKSMVAYEDVVITETDRTKKGIKYATSQKAEFMAQEDKILLSGFPSVYQEYDTVTGELITIYRKKSLVEVSHANAFHGEVEK